MSRLLIASNRLPVTLRVSGDEVSIAPSDGGLATAMRALHQEGEGLWIGWTGNTSPLSPDQQQAVAVELRSLRLAGVDLTAAEVSRYYERYSNSVLWPLFHQFLDRVEVDDPVDAEVYEAVNERFAAALADHFRPGDRVWIHDYQLLFVPAMLRRRIPEARIGFFLHTPFPALEVFRALPRREQLLQGLLGADVIGFHTASYRRHFVQAAAALLGVAEGADTVHHEGRQVRLGVYPIGVDAAELARLAGSEGVRAEAQRIRANAPDGKIVLGVDRLDYTKGLLFRLGAIERFLDRAPRIPVRFVQLAVPTRERARAYEQMRREVNERVSRINARHGSIDAVPIHLLYRSTDVEALTALYVSADVMLVTPVRDGMNLVAKEYAATRLDDTGVLVLSEFTGAAAELSEALIVNPYDIEGVAAAIDAALHMPEAEQRRRMAALRRRVAEHDVHRWGRSFLDDLGYRSGSPPAVPRPEQPAAGSGGSAGANGLVGANGSPGAGGSIDADLTARLRAAVRLTLILDYDGTLVPIAPLPHLAAPDPELLALLEGIAARPGTRVHVASGRRREDLEAWLGALPIDLHAEHGTWSRAPRGGSWRAVPLPPLPWKEPMLAFLDDVCRRTPGSLIEDKTAIIAFHYRAADRALARARLREVVHGIGDLLRAHDLELVRGARVLEVRVRGLRKSLVAARALGPRDEDAEVLAAGDDRTDEDLFAALPPSALTIHVGAGPSRAAYRLPDPAAVRSLLRALLA